MEKRERIIVAIDTPDILIAGKLVGSLKDVVKIFKVGSELFTACGHEAIKMIKDNGCEVFLDLKFHDIPNTVANVAQVVSRFDVFMFNVHALGGKKMMKAARDAVYGEAEKRGLAKPIILAVTILTSLNEVELEQDLGINRKIKDEVLHLASMAKSAGLDGVVASAHEVRLIKENIGEDFLVVTPGIRPEWSVSGDQARIVTPRQAFERGSDYIVIGRPITASTDPLDAALKIVEEVSV